MAVKLKKNVRYNYFVKIQVQVLIFFQQTK
jgi:hypothetical protein